MKKTILITIFVAFNLFAQDELLQKAREYELLGEYKKAMLIYKQLALKTQTSIDIESVQTQDIIETQEDSNSILSGINHIKNSFEAVEDSKTNSAIEQALASAFNIYPYKENYFLPISYDTKSRLGREQNEAKFQISVKKPITYNLLGLNETINFAYTQTSWWQLYADSAPFRETNYQPEVYMIAPYFNHENSALKAYKVGLLHESNGQHGDDSRSWNRVYIEGYYQYDSFFMIPRIWYRIPEKKSEDDNPDIEDYLGYGDINLIYVSGEHIFKLLLRNNLKFRGDNRGFVQANWLFPFPGSKDTFGYIQLSNGYGDSLIDYDKEISRIGFGISLSR